VVGPGSNHAPADSPSAESAASTHRELDDSRTARLDWQNTADCVEIPGNDGGCP
jgi:hypothetical protein